MSKVINYSYGTQMMPVFRGNHDAQKQTGMPVTENFLKQNTDSVVQLNKKESFSKKLWSYPSLYLLPLLPIMVAETIDLIRLTSLKNAPKKDLEKAKEKLAGMAQGMKKKYFFLAGVAVVICGFMNFLNESDKGKNLSKAQKLVNDFNSKNKSDLKLKVASMDKSFVAAVTDPVSGQIIVGHKFIEDSIFAKTHLSHLMKHELVHSKQYLMMAAQQDGIAKLNYVSVLKIAQRLNEPAKQEILSVYKELQGDSANRYVDAKMDVFGYKINLKDYITALYKVLFEPETSNAHNIPIIINKEYYQAFRDRHGKLSDEQEQMAKKYLEAYAHYPYDIKLLDTFKKNSPYKKNLLEQEAYEMNPWYTR